MIQTNDSYPHPVLNHNDDIDGIFKYKLSHYNDINFFYFIVNFELDNEDLENIIKEGKAVYILEFHCSQTFYREAFTYSGKEKNEFRIEADKLKDMVYVEGYIVAKSNIEQYSNSRANNDYNGFTFSISKGDTLAIGGTVSFIASKDYDALNAASSIMQINEGDKKYGEMEIDLSGDKIVIFLCKSDYQLYALYKKDKAAYKIFHSMIVLPVLIEALYKMSNSGSSLTGVRWYQILNKKLGKENLSLDGNFISIAQKLLDNPLSRSFEGLDYRLIENGDING